jgi:Subtilase family
VPRRLTIVVAAALCALGTAAAAAGDAPSEWWLTSIDANPTAAPGPGVPIVVIDGGVDATVAAFSGRANTTYLDDPSLAGPDDYHATAVASLAAAPDVNGFEGVYPNAALELWNAGRSADGIDAGLAARGVLAASEHCPAVINLSFGGTAPNPGVQDAILRAVRAGCLVVAAAGNNGLDGNQTTYPAAYTHVLTVAATDLQDNPAPFSSSGDWVDLAAPGVQMSAPVPLSYDASGVATDLAGTSFSAPLVSAAAAWVWTARPGLSASQVAAVLRASAHRTGSAAFDERTGYGVLDVAAALAQPTPPADPEEPNDDISEVKPGLLFSAGQPPLTTASRPSARIMATLLRSEDPSDVYRIWVPARRVVRASIAANGAATVKIWRHTTITLAEPTQLRSRDIAGKSIAGGAVGRYAYAEVELKSNAINATYVLTVKTATP